jgi:hypothetical protein
LLLIMISGSRVNVPDDGIDGEVASFYGCDLQALDVQGGATVSCGVDLRRSKSLCRLFPGGDSSGKLFSLLPDQPVSGTPAHATDPWGTSTSGPAASTLEESASALCRDAIGLA